MKKMIATLLLTVACGDVPTEVGFAGSTNHGDGTAGHSTRAAIRGTVVVYRSGFELDKPLPKARVTLTIDGTDFRLQVTADDRGRFDIRNLRAAEYEIDVQGYLLGLIGRPLGLPCQMSVELHEQDQDVEIRCGYEPDDVRITWLSGYAFEDADDNGKLTDGDKYLDGLAVAIQLYSTEEGGPTRQELTNIHSYYRFWDVFPGHYVAKHIGQECYALDSRFYQYSGENEYPQPNFSKRQQRLLHFPFRRVESCSATGDYGSIIGSVTIAGRGLPDVTVSLDARRHTTDNGGLYAFTAVPVGHRTVTISGFDTTRYVFPVTQRSITLHPSQTAILSFDGSTR